MNITDSISVQWMEEIYVPYIKWVILEDNLPANQNSMLFLNFYPVHTSKAFIQYIKENYSNMLLVFVPANCKSCCSNFTLCIDALSLGTGKFQPANVGLQRIIKH